MNRRKVLQWASVMAIGILMGFTAIAVAQETESWTAAGVPLPQPRIVKTPHIGFICRTLTSESTRRNWHQTQNEIEHRGWKLTTILDAPAPNQQRDGIQTLIQKNVDAIVIVYLPMEPLRDLILEARKKGIGVYGIDTELKPGVIVNPTQPNGSVGAVMAHYLIDRLDMRGNITIINFPAHQGVRQRVAAARGLFTSPMDFPNLKILATEELLAPGYEKQGYDAAAAWVLKYGKSLNAIYSGADPFAMFAMKALEAARVSREQTFMTGIDGGSEAYDAIRRGSNLVATMSQPFEFYTHTTFDIIEEVQIKGIGIGKKGSSIPRSRTIYAHPVLTTEENVPAVGAPIHTVFASTYYNAAKKDAWYFWGKPYVVGEGKQVGGKSK